MHLRIAYTTVLRPMSESIYLRFRDTLKKDYAHTMFRAKEVPSLDEGFAKAESQIREYLPNGLKSQGQLLREIVVIPQQPKPGWSPSQFSSSSTAVTNTAEESVGFLWAGLNFDPFAKEVALGKGKSWLHYIFIQEEKRKTGYGLNAIRQLEKELQELHQQEHLAGSVYLDNPAVMKMFKLLEYDFESFPEKGYGFVRKKFSNGPQPQQSKKM